jgi:hypothetical protein
MRRLLVVQACQSTNALISNQEQTVLVDKLASSLMKERWVMGGIQTPGRSGSGNVPAIRLLSSCTCSLLYAVGNIPGASVHKLDD